MKKLINQIALHTLIVVLLISAGIHAKAQTGVPLLDDLRNMYNPVTQHLPPDAVFSEMVGATPHFRSYTGDPLNDNVQQVSEFRQSLLSLRNASLDYQSLPDLDSLQSIVRSYRDNGMIPIGIINYNYMSFRDSAKAWGEVAYDTIAEVVDFTGAPDFQERRTANVAVFDIVYNTDNPTFIIPSDLYFTNTDSISNLMIDFGDGNGYQPVLFDVPYTISFPGQTEIVTLLELKLKYDCPLLNDAIPALLDYVFRVPLNKVEVEEPDESLLVNQDPGFANVGYCGDIDLTDPGMVNEAKVHIKYGLGNTSGTFKKPFILVEGFDLDTDPNDNNFGVLKWSTYWEGRSWDEDGVETRFNLADLKVLSRRLYQAGYDAIFVDYKDGSGDMYKNGNALIKVIQWVNANKTSDEELVVMGASMGGLLSRYALRKMELMGCGHCTKLYGTFDSPHQGANVPLSMQYVVDEFQHMNADIKMGYDGLKRAAAQQMLIHNISPGAIAKRADWKNWLNTYGHPQIPKRVAITNADPNGQDQFSQGAVLYGADMDINGLLKVSARLFSANNGGKGFELKAPGKKFDKLVNFPSGHTYYDHVAGSQAPWLSMLTAKLDKVKWMVDFINSVADQSIFTRWINVNFSDFGVANQLTTFVPTFSSLDMTTQNLNPTLALMYDKSLGEHLEPDPSNHPFDAIFFHDSNDPAKQGNQIHVLVDADPGQNVDWIMDQLASVSAPFTELPAPQGSTYNMDGSVSVVTRIPKSTINNGGKLHLYGDFQLNFAQPSDPWPTTQGLTFDYKTSACDPSITINNGGELVLGDDNRPYPNNNKVNLFIATGGMVRINNGGTLTIHEGSRLIIEEGAQLVLSGNTNIVLAGDDAVMKVYGQIILENGADFSFTKGSANRSGYLFFFKTATNSSEFISPTGSGSIIDLSGASYNSDNIAIVQDGAWKVPAGIDTLKLFSGMIRYANNGSMEVNCPVKAQTVTFDEVYTNAVGTTGLKTYGQPGVELKACIFKNLVTGMDVDNGSSTTMPQIDNCHFLDCTTGMSYVGGSFEPVRFRADGCNIGAFVYIDQHSAIDNPILTNNVEYGLYLGNLGTAQVEVFLDEGLVKNNETGIFQDAGNLGITAACLDLEDNDTGIKTFGNLNLSTTTSANGQTGGNCTFEDNGAGITVFGELYLDEGYNNFTSSAPAPYNFITGHIPFAYLPASGNLSATNNYWNPAPASLSTAGSNWYNITSFNGVNPHPYNVLLTGSMLTSASNNCGGGSGTGGTSGGGGGYVPGMRNGTVSSSSDIASMQLSPNPYTGKGALKLSIHTLEKGNCQIEIVDQLGKTRLKTARLLQKGENELSLNLEQLAVGIYIMRCSQNGTVLSKAFVKH